MLLTNIDIHDFNNTLYVLLGDYLALLADHMALKEGILRDDETLLDYVALIENLESRNSELTKELGKRDAAIEDLKRSADREIADLQKKIDSLGKNSDYLENMNYYKKAYETSVGMVHRLEDEKKALYEDLVEAQKLYKHADKLAGELMECCNGCLWAQERASRDYEAEELRRDIATLEELVAEKENAFHEVNCKLNESNSKVKELTGLYDQACDYIDDLEDEITIRDSSEPCENYCKAVAELTSYLDDLSDKYYEKAETVHNLEAKITYFTARIQELETELNEAYTLSEDRRRLYSELKRNYDDLMTYVECLQNENADLANLNSRDLADVESICAELEYSRKEYDSLAHDYMISEANVQALEEEIAKLEKELEDAYK